MPEYTNLGDALGGYFTGRLAGRQQRTENDFKQKQLDLQKYGVDQQREAERERLTYDAVSKIDSVLLDPVQAARLRTVKAPDGRTMYDAMGEYRGRIANRQPGQPINLPEYNFFVSSAGHAPATPGDGAPGPSGPQLDLGRLGSVGTGQAQAPVPTLNSPSILQAPQSRPQVGMTPLAGALGLPTNSGAHTPAPPGSNPQVSDDKYAREIALLANKTFQDHPGAGRFEVKPPTKRAPDAPAPSPVDPAQQAPRTVPTASIDQVIAADSSVVAARQAVEDAKAAGFPLDSLLELQTKVGKAEADALKGIGERFGVAHLAEDYDRAKRKDEAAITLTEQQGKYYGSEVQSKIDARKAGAEYKDALIRLGNRKVDATLQMGKEKIAASKEVARIRSQASSAKDPEVRQAKLNLLRQKYAQNAQKGYITSAEAAELKTLNAIPKLVTTRTAAGKQSQSPNPQWQEAQTRIEAIESGIAARGQQDIDDARIVAQNNPQGAGGNTVNIITGPQGATGAAPADNTAPPSGRPQDLPTNITSKAGAMKYYRSKGKSDPVIKNYLSNFPGLK